MSAKADFHDQAADSLGEAAWWDGIREVPGRTGGAAAGGCTPDERPGMPEIPPLPSIEEIIAALCPGLVRGRGPACPP
jgi:hypothetical protein